MPRETTEARPRRITPLVTDGGRAIDADKSPFQQHDLSNLIVGHNHLKYTLSRTKKPKYHHKTNTFCPSFMLAPINFNTGFSAPRSRKVATKPTRFVHPSCWLPSTSIPVFPHQEAEKSPQNQHVLSYNPGAPGRTDRREANDPLGELITDKQKRRGANLTVGPSAYPINTVHVRPNSSSEDSRRRGHYGRRCLSLYASTVGSQPCQNDNTT